MHAASSCCMRTMVSAFPMMTKPFMRAMAIMAHDFMQSMEWWHRPIGRMRKFNQWMIGVMLVKTLTLSTQIKIATNDTFESIALNGRNIASIALDAIMDSVAITIPIRTTFSAKTGQTRVVTVLTH